MFFCVEAVGVLRKLTNHMYVIFIPLILGYVGHFSKELQVLVYILLVVRQLTNQIVDLLDDGLVLPNPGIPNNINVFRLEQISQHHELRQLARLFDDLKVVIHLEKNFEKLRLVNPGPKLVVLTQDHLVTLANLNYVAYSLQLSLKVRTHDHLQTQRQLQHRRPLFNRVTILRIFAQTH